MEYTTDGSNKACIKIRLVLKQAHPLADLTSETFNTLKIALLPVVLEILAIYLILQDRSLNIYTN